MYSGTMIEDLIAAVARAESHARTAQQAQPAEPAIVLSETVYRNLVFQAPYYAAMMGAA